MKEDKEKLLTQEMEEIKGIEKASFHGFESKKADNKKAMYKLVIVTIICFIFMGIEFAGGYISNSLAIMTDAAHMLSDVAGFMISYFALFMGNKPATFSLSFGYHRAEVLGALTSILLIWGLIIWLFIEAIERCIKAEEIKPEIMLITAIVGLICNIINIFTLHSCGEGHTHHEEPAGEHEHEHEHHPRQLSHCDMSKLEEAALKIKQSRQNSLAALSHDTSGALLKNGLQ